MDTLKARLTERFGADSVASVTNENGDIDMEKLMAFAKDRFGDSMRSFGALPAGPTQSYAPQESPETMLLEALQRPSIIDRKI